jgi:hypothetical protein
VAPLITRKDSLIKELVKLALRQPKDRKNSEGIFSLSFHHLERNLLKFGRDITENYKEVTSTM